MTLQYGAPHSDAEAWVDQDGTVHNSTPVLEVLEPADQQEHGGSNTSNTSNTGRRGRGVVDPSGGLGPVFPVPDTGGEEHGNALYADIAALLDGGIPDPPKPVLLHREDGHALFYKARVNYLFGDPESGKTWVAQAATAEALQAGRKVLFVDIDHNGVDATVYRFLDMGVDEEILRNIDLFRYVAPEDQAHLVAVVADAKQWRPAVAVVDSVGELLPMLRLSSNSPDDFTNAHTAVLKPLAAVGAAVLAIDHLPKNAENRANGPTGTAAKRRAIGGVSLRVTIKEQFTPGRGGEAYLSVNKDRHGGLRRYCPTEGREPSAGLFVLDSSGDGIRWKVQAPKLGEAAAADGVSAADLAALDQLDPPPENVRDAKTRLKWGTSRAARVLSEWRSQRSRNVPEEHGTDGGIERSPFLPSGVRNEEHGKAGRTDPACRTCGQRLISPISQQRGWCERDRCKLANQEAS